MFDALEELLQKLAQELFEQILAEKTGPWVSGVIDLRFDGNGGVLGKIRVRKPDGELESVGFNSSISLLLHDLDEIRNAAGPEWFGLVMTITPERDCEVKFNYDADCEQDSTFFED